jgi:murein L,D-transpeptidase YafK
MNPENMTEEAKEENSKIKKYFKNRYISFLKTLKEDNVKKKEEEEKAKQKEERLKQKMQKKFGIDNVQSRFRSESQHPPQVEGEKAGSKAKPRSENRLM